MSIKYDRITAIEKVEINGFLNDVYKGLRDSIGTAPATAQTPHRSGPMPFGIKVMAKKRTAEEYDKMIDTSVSPDASLWNRLTPYGRKLVSEVLDEEVKEFGCNKTDLEFRISKHGAISAKPRTGVSQSKKGQSKMGKDLIKVFDFNGQKMKLSPGKLIKVKIPSESKPEYHQSGRRSRFQIP